MGRRRWDDDEEVNVKCEENSIMIMGIHRDAGIVAFVDVNAGHRLR